MPRGSSPKREREYKELKSRFKKEGRYKGREEQVAARIVNKQRKAYGETKGEKAKEKKGESPDRGLPISRYKQKTISEVRSKLQHLPKKKVKQLEGYEKKHKNRKTLVKEMEKAAR